MITKQLIKQEIDNVPNEHLPVLYRIVLALGDEIDAELGRPSEIRRSQHKGDGNQWRDFVARIYGCMADAPIERHAQGRYESREDLL